MTRPGRGLLVTGLVGLVVVLVGVGFYWAQTRAPAGKPNRYGIARFDDGQLHFLVSACERSGVGSLGLTDLSYNPVLGVTLHGGAQATNDVPISHESDAYDYVGTSPKPDSDATLTVNELSTQASVNLLVGEQPRWQLSEVKSGTILQGDGRSSALSDWYSQTCT